MNRFLPLMIHRVLYLSGAENGSEFRAQRSVRMHIQHMHISIIMFSEMGAYLIAAPPFRIRVTLGFTVIIKIAAQFVKYNPKDLHYAQIFVWNSQNSKLCCRNYLRLVRALFRLSRYRQYWFMLIPSLRDCSASWRCRDLGMRSLNWPE